GFHRLLWLNLPHELHKVRDLVQEIRFPNCTDAGNAITGYRDPLPRKFLPEEIRADSLFAAADSTSVADPNGSVFVFRQDALNSDAHAGEGKVNFADDRIRVARVRL